MRFSSTIYPGIFLALVGCAPDAPLVVDRDGTPLPYSVVVAAGIRDGYYLNAELALFAPDLITSLQLQLRIEIAIRPRLLEGTWTLRTESGRITADWLEFFGGQGGSPVIAGRFRLHAAAPDTGSSYIVNLPKTQIKPSGLDFQGVTPFR